MKLTLITAAALAALAVAAAAVAGKPLIFAQAQAVGSIKNPMTLKIKPGSMVLDTITVKPGGSFGWHQHGSPVAVVIASGTLTVLDRSIGNCAPFKVSKGQAFIEPPNHAHLARNEGTKPVTMYAMFLGIPKGAQANRAAARPTGCAS
jgi:quercetin dioxygenase-like cupin family protein